MDEAPGATVVRRTGAVDVVVLEEEARVRLQELEELRASFGNDRARPSTNAGEVVVLDCGEIGPQRRRVGRVGQLRCEPEALVDGFQASKLGRVVDLIEAVYED